VSRGLTSFGLPVGRPHIRFLILGVLLVCLLSSSCGDPIDPFFPILEVTPDSLNFGGVLTQRSFRIVNEGTKALQWSAESSDTFITISPETGELAPSPGDNDTVVTVTVNRAGLEDSLYESTIKVRSSNDGKRDVQVKMTVGVFELPIVGQIDTPQEARAVAVAGNYAYVADGNFGSFYIVDVTEPENPKKADEMTLADGKGIVVDVAVEGSSAYVVDLQELCVVDVSIPTSAKQCDSCCTSGLVLPYGVVLGGSFAFVADNLFGLVVINVDNSSKPHIVSGCATYQDPEGVDKNGNYVFLAGWSPVKDSRGGYLESFNVGNPTNPQPLDTIPLTYWGRGCSVSGSHVYVATMYGQFGTLDIVDVSDPTSVTLVKVVNTTGAATDVVVDGNYAYVVGPEIKLRVYDVSTPWAPKFVAHHQNSLFRPEGVAVAGNFVYVADGKDGGLRIFDRSLLRP